ncbi:Crp/Fnr family transcriptional regulator [Muricoccus pecuniae]|uniref:CRP-like cAMP-binding protein n=1 Tax=Muricoccus pecuniae TaxID=693023 RepID=A0A840YKB5_9PROT|nr:Crp/Fnr family transcriptional regulator [Roseomonas pecuniae]MBB5695302.1 CRP-like cAMP-binding protein [Roseomonas pecuniae]
MPPPPKPQSVWSSAAMRPRRRPPPLPWQDEPCLMDDLGRLPFFRPFGPAALEPLAAVARWRGFSAGQTVLEAGDPARDVCFIAEGELRVVARSTGGHEMILNELHPGGMFGEIAAIDGRGRSASIVALTRARVCAIAAAPFMGFALSTPEASQHLMRMLAALVREKDARLMELAVLPVRARLAALLLRLSRPREGGGRVVSPPRPHHELASRIGTRREVVSRTLSAMARDGLADLTKGGLVLPRPGVLQAEVEAGYAASRG